MSTAAVHVLSAKPKRTEKPLTVEALREELQRCATQIGLLTRERNQIHAERHAALVASEDLVQLRELQTQLAELDASITVIHEKRAALQAELKTAERRAAVAEMQNRRTERETLTKEWRGQVARVQAAVDELARLCMTDMITYDAGFCRLLPELPSGVDTARFSRDLPGLVSRRFEALIRGPKACRGTLETGHQLLASGAVDLVKALTGYVDVIERDAQSPPPEAA